MTIHHPMPATPELATHLSRYERLAERPTRTHTAELIRRVSRASNAQDRTVALIRLVLWCADADRSRVMTLAAQTMSAARSTGDRILIAKAGYASAVATIAQQAYVEPYHDLLRLSMEFEELGRPVDAAWCDLYGSVALELLGDAASAVLFADRALSTFRRCDNTAGQARSLNKMGVGQGWVGRHAEALSLFWSGNRLGFPSWQRRDPIDCFVERCGGVHESGAKSASRWKQ